MGTVPTPYTWTHEEIPDFRQMNERLRDMTTFLMNPPMIRLRKTNAQSLANITDVAISWNYVDFESENMWDATLPTRIKPSTPGWYIGTCGSSFAPNATGYRQIDIRKNNSATDRAIRLKFEAIGGAGDVGRGNVFMEQFNGTTDYIEMVVWQNSGGALGVDVSILETQPDLALRWFAPL